MTINKEANEVHITLNEDETLVFYEWLCNFNERNELYPFDDVSEQQILYDIEAEFEKVLTSTFKNEYEVLLSNARQRIKNIE